MALIAWVGPAVAQDSELALSQFVQTQWTRRNGLPQNSITAILQTRDGFLWLGTQLGLTRFDGFSFQTWTRREIPEMPSQSVLSLAEDSRGVLWIGTQAGLFTMNGRTYAPNPSLEPLAEYEIPALVAGGAHEMWIGTARRGIYRYREGRLEQMCSGADLGLGRLNDLLRDPVGGIWIAKDNGLYRFSGGEVSRVPLGETTDEPMIFNLHMDRERTLWLATDNGLIRQKQERRERLTEEHGLNSNVVTTIAADRQGHLWVGTFRGINRIRGDRIDSVGTASDFGRDILEAMLVDREGNLWIGRQRSGLSRFRRPKLLTYAREEGLLNDVVRAVFEDSEGNVWLGTDGGLGRFQQGLRQWLTTDDGLPGNTVFSIAGDERGALWIGTMAGGLARLFENRIDVFNVAGGHLLDDRVRVLFVDRRKRLWVGTQSGLHLFDGKRSHPVPGPMGETATVQIAQDGRGRIWVGSQWGLGVFESDEPADYRAIPRVQGTTIVSLHIDESDVVWAGSYGAGLFRVAGERVVAVTRADGLHDDKIFHIQEDDEDHLWMSSNRGIFRVDRHQLNRFAAGSLTGVECTSFGTGDGMKTVECNGGTQSPGWKTRDGFLWFATTRGAVVVKPENLSRNRVPPAVLIEAVEIDGQAHDPRVVVQAPHDMRKLAIRYTATSLSDVQKVRFRYRLEGFDETWHEAGERRVAFYTSLPPGDYRFQVIASNNDGVWNQTGRSLTLHVPAFGWRDAYWLPLLFLLVTVFFTCLHLVRRRNGLRRIAFIADCKGESRAELNRLCEAQIEANRELVESFHRAGMAEVGMNVLQNVNQTLTHMHHSIRIMERAARELRATPDLHLVSQSISANEADLGHFFEYNARGQGLPDQLSATTDSLNRIHDSLLEEVVDFRDQVHQVCELVEAQQQYAKVSSYSETVDLSILIEDVLRIKQSILLENHVEVVQDLAPLPLIRLSKARLMQVMVQLVRGGRKTLSRADKGNRRLVIRTRTAEPGWVVVQISYGGIGFAAEELKVLAREPDLETLMGLDFALCRELLREMDGRLVIETGEDDRALIAVHLPIGEEPEEWI
ncbi:two-component regulator propeller domain-containing protein [Sulfidibacter corallicola]|uniref:Two component regulator three Y domain-containing protein n=1 Tax=Sulfidibacter corallicola TaxID=2818388 RepID=A0A8A4TV57_SULCO|nr:two-component regulator propeller domain-containing protein [Sulfidibacter corallicola]QTD53001.1 hypothetical protein J3U87_11105 [Sulfidibacter corallicola]